MNVIEFKKGIDTTSALEVLDKLREQIVSGKAIALIAVTIEPDDVTCGWSATTTSVTRLRMMGAVASLAQGIAEGDM